ncbi:MAG: hypothetical protein C0598_03255, partial [Marinilabiliales bacterium]
GIALELINLTTDSVFVNGVSHIFSHNDGIIQIPLTSQISENDTLEVRVFYHGQPFHESWGGFHFSGDYAFNLGVGFESIPHNLGKSWFACIDDFTDRASYDVYATVSNDKKAVGGGVLMGTVDNGDGTTTWHWQLNQKIPTYLASLSTGDYYFHSDLYYGLEDTIPISIYSRPQDSLKIAASFTNIKTITQIFENHFGPYPFDRIGITATALGAMEHATNISYPYSGFSGNSTYEWWYTHELSHMWFGDMVTCSTAEDMWLNEGWATFCQIFYTEDLYGHEEFKLGMREKHKEVMKETHIIDNGYYALNNIPQEYTYGSTAYDKGAVVTNALKTYLGDSIFFDAVRAFLQNFAYQSVSSIQMRDFLSQHTGINMNGFFDNWVFNPGTPLYSFDSTSINQAGNSFHVNIYPNQKRKGYDFIGDDNILQIAYLKSNYQLEYDTIHFSGKSGYSVKTLDYEPLAIIMDADEMMMDATTDNYKVFHEEEAFIFPDTYFKLTISQLQDSAFIQATHNWAGPDSLKNEVQGLRISKERFWTINGYLTDGFQAEGRFYYDNSSSFDSELILSETDSVVILYRENAGDEWHIVPQYRNGIWSIGYIFVEDLQLGEYTLGVYNLSVGKNENSEKQSYKVYPNPSRGELNFSFPQKGKYLVKLKDESGKSMDSIQFSGNTKKWVPKINNLNGAYILYIYESGTLISIRKVIFVR